jgi:hypothetical protein
VDYFRSVHLNSSIRHADDYAETHSGDYAAAAIYFFSAFARRRMSAHIFNAREVSDYWQELQQSNQSNFGKFFDPGNSCHVTVGPGNGRPADS